MAALMSPNMRVNRDEYKRDWKGFDWNQSYSAHRKPKSVNPVIGIAWLCAITVMITLAREFLFL